MPTFTKAAIERLGKRLRSEGATSEDDLRLMQEYIAEYEDVRAAAVRILQEELGISATSRLKTITTIIEKLKRSKTRLNTMQDIAGLRIVMEPGDGLFEQTELADRIRAVFPDHARPVGSGFRARR